MPRGGRPSGINWCLEPPSGLPIGAPLDQSDVKVQEIPGWKFCVYASVCLVACSASTSLYDTLSSPWTLPVSRIAKATCMRSYCRPPRLEQGVFDKEIAIDCEVCGQWPPSISRTAKVLLPRKRAKSCREHSRCTSRRWRKTSRPGVVTKAKILCTCLRRTCSCYPP